jgi:hypothetical protein
MNDPVFLYRREMVRPESDERTGKVSWYLQLSKQQTDDQPMTSFFEIIQLIRRSNLSRLMRECTFKAQVCENRLIRYETICNYIRAAKRLLLLATVIMSIPLNNIPLASFEGQIPWTNGKSDCNLVISCDLVMGCCSAYLNFRCNFIRKSQCQM